MTAVPGILAGITGDKETGARIDREWQDLIAVMKANPDDPDVYRRAVRWVLVNGFGTKSQMLFDPIFAARVTVVEGALAKLNELRVR